MPTSNTKSTAPIYKHLFLFLSKGGLAIALAIVSVLTLSGCMLFTHETTVDNARQNDLKNQEEVRTDLALTAYTDKRHFETKAYSRVTMLEQINQLYTLNNNILAQEITQLSQQQGIVSKIKLTVALSRTQKIADSERALQILDDIIQQSKNVEAKYYQWVLLLRPIIAEQFQLRTRVLQQAQQLQNNTRRIDNLNNKINALRAIEESLAIR